MPVLRHDLHRMIRFGLLGGSRRRRTGNSPRRPA